jgi:hypothetical protein
MHLHHIRKVGAPVDLCILLEGVCKWISASSVASFWEAPSARRC